MGIQPAVADRSNQLAGCIEVANQFQDVGISPQLVRSPAAGNDQTLEVDGLHGGDLGVGGRRVAVLAVKVMLSRRAGHRDLRSGFDQSQFGIPEFQILVVVVQENQELVVFHGFADGMAIAPLWLRGFGESYGPMSF